MQSERHRTAALRAWETRRANRLPSCPRCRVKGDVERVAKHPAFLCTNCGHQWTDVVRAYPLVHEDHNPLDGSWEFRRFGDDVVGRGVVGNGTRYGWFVASSWKPSGNALRDEVERGELLTLNDGTHFKLRSPRRSFFPRDLPVPGQDPLGAAKAWVLAEQARTRTLVGQVYPEVLSKPVVSQYDGLLVAFRPGTYLTSDELDDVLDQGGGDALKRFLGTAIEHDVFGRGTLTCSREGGVALVAWRLSCATQNCRRKVKTHTMSGCHHGAWCYLADPKTGKYQGDLRNVQVLCRKCSGD